MKERTDKSIIEQELGEKKKYEEKKEELSEESYHFT
jgi:hypothetical protein